MCNRWHVTAPAEAGSCTGRASPGTGRHEGAAQGM